MPRFLNSLFRYHKKYKFDTRDSDATKMHNTIACLKQKIADANLRSTKNHKIIDSLSQRIRSLCYELYEMRRLEERSSMSNISSTSIDTDCIIDLQNDLLITEDKIQHLQTSLLESEQQSRELHEQLILANRKMEQSEKYRMQLQILSNKAEMVAVCYRMMAKERNWIDGTLEMMQNIENTHRASEFRLSSKQCYSANSSPA
ncbi:unnamed protein product [Thelazia callipaeda]|uniref:TDP43_N domain-containing protein n=1 Tax=Thelazia callipaeda TaxID=103827 RepID=A0A0N5CQP4_THECL|nr:unnamed protein product [Thelazia callipaeda]